MVARTAISEFGPNTVDSWEVGLSTQPAFGSDLLGEEGDLTGKLLQLVHHLIDGTFEVHDFRVHLLCVDEHLLAQVTHGDSGDDVANLTESFLEGQVGLLVLAELPFEGADILDAMFEGQTLVVQLLVDLGAEVVDVFALVLDLIGLLVQVVAEIVELLFGEGSGGHITVAIGLPGGKPVADPSGSLLGGTTARGFGFGGSDGGGGGRVDELGGGGLSRGYGEVAGVDDPGLCFEILDTGSEAR